MYTVRVNYDNTVIHNPSIGLLLNNPKLILEDNCAGSFEFDMSPDHPGFSSVIRFKSEISVYRDGVEIWAGRPVEESIDFYGVKHVYCEGLLSALFDTIQVPGEYHDISVYSFLDTMLKAHNAQITPTYRYRPFFYAGSVEFEDELYRYTNYETTLECINDKLISRLGGHLSMSRRDAFRFDLNYRKGYGKTSDQVIRFGQNLLDYTKNFDASELATVIVPLGARLEGQSDIQALEKYLDVSSVNGGSIYVRNESLISTYGVCVKVVHWDDVTIPQNLLTKAQQYLAEAQYDNMQLEVKAVDFHLADENVPPIDLLDEIRVVSPPHDLDRYFPVTKMEIPLDNPEDTILTLGTVVKTSLTSQSNARSTAIKELVDNYVPPSVILETAKDQATRLIQSGELGGHVVVLENEIYITDNVDISKAQKMWRWNSAGLGYTTGGKDGSYGTAITMDGKIVADYITAGTMKADRISGGTLILGGASNTNGIFLLKDKNKKTIITLNNNGLLVEGNGVIEARASDSANSWSAKLNSGRITFTAGDAGRCVVGTGTHDFDNYQYYTPENTNLYGVEQAIYNGEHFIAWSAPDKKSGQSGYYDQVSFKFIYVHDVNESTSIFKAPHYCAVHTDSFFMFAPLYLRKDLYLSRDNSRIGFIYERPVIENDRRIYRESITYGYSGLIQISGQYHRFINGIYVGVDDS